MSIVDLYLIWNYKPERFLTLAIQVNDSFFLELQNILLDLLQLKVDKPSQTWSVSIRPNALQTT